MVHKKYIKRGGKVFGPYLYQNYRENGVTKTKYLGLAPEAKKLRGNWNFSIIAGVFLLVIAFVFFYSFFYSGITGRVTDEVTPASFAGENENTSVPDIPEITPEIIPEETPLIPADNTSINPEENVTLPETNVTIPENTTETNTTIPEENVTIPETNITPENITPAENITPVIPIENITPQQNVTNVTIPETNITVPEVVNETTNVTLPAQNETQNITEDTNKSKILTKLFNILGAGLAPDISWVQVNLPIYSSTVTSAYAVFSDADGDIANLTFMWYVNGSNVENDTVLDVTLGSIAVAYLNISKRAGDIINLSVFANDSLNVSSTYSFRNIIWDNLDIRLTTGIIYDLDCDNSYCYSVDGTSGYFLKINKTSGWQLWNVSTGFSVRPSTTGIYGIDCDDYFCYGGDNNGYFLKVNKTDGWQYWNVSVDYRVQPSNTYLYDVYCDNNFCYTGDNNGYLVKVNKTSGWQIWNISTGFQVRPTDSLRSMYCDSYFCYGGDYYGYLFKVNKSGVSAIDAVYWNQTGNYAPDGILGTTNYTPLKPSTTGISSAYCYADFCYFGDYSGYMHKLNKTSGFQYWNASTNYQVKPSATYIYDLFVNDYIYGVDGNGYLLKVNKTGWQLWNASSGFQMKPSANSIYGVACDTYFCYGGDGSGYITKVFKNANLTAEVFLEVNFVSPTTAAGNRSQNYISANVSLSSLMTWDTLAVYLYNDTGLVNVSSTNEHSLSSFYVNFSGLGTGSYYLNATLNNSRGEANVSETRSINLTDIVPPSITPESPVNTTTYYSSVLNFSAIVNDTWGVDSCLFSLDGAANVTMTLNSSKNFANYTYSGISSFDYHNLTVGCNDSFNNWNFATVSNFRVVLLDLLLSNFTMQIYSNTTLIRINVSNLGPTNASNVNVSCYLDGVFFESKEISLIEGNTSFMTNCTLSLNASNNRVLNITLDGNNSIAERNEANNFYMFYFNVTQLANITVFTSLNVVNTTDTMNVYGQITASNGSNLPNQKFVIKLNDVLVSTDTLNHSNFAFGIGTATNVNATGGTLKLNFSSWGSLSNYEELYTTDAYKTDSKVASYVSEGWYEPSGSLFWLANMLLNVGNITYKFDSESKFYNASAYIEIYNAPSDPGANTSLWYSFDNSTWSILNSTLANGITIGGAISGIAGKSSIYIRINSDTFGGTKATPVTRFEFNHTDYNYPSSGSYISPSISLPNVTYTILKWDKELNGQEVKVQLRESSDNLSWSGWSSNYTSSTYNDISIFSKQYLQYRVWLTTTNQSLTPVVYSVNISYFNASTNSTGGYSKNITVASDILGSLALSVNVLQNASSDAVGILGSNSTTLVVWTHTNVSYSAIKGYSSPQSNYSVFANFTRRDNGGLISGTINITIYNSDVSVMMSKTCYGESCVASFFIPGNLSWGNYTINVTAFNETAYCRNASTTSFADYLEENSTSGTLYLPNYTISDYNPVNTYTFYLNATIANAGNATMRIPHVWSSSLQLPSSIGNETETSPCSTIPPNSSCNATIRVTVKSGVSNGSKSVTWRANWTDNDGSISGGSNYMTYTSYVNILSNASLELSNYSVNKTIQHGASGSFSFDLDSIGTDTIMFINISPIDGSLPASWVGINPNWIDSIIGGSTDSATVTINVPSGTEPGNYSGIVNVSTINAGELYINVNVTVPSNFSWYFAPSANFTYNNSHPLNTEGYVANYTIVNNGNTNLTIAVTYTPRTDDPSCACNGVLPCDYSCFGTDLFASNYGVYNPTQVNVTKAENTTFTVYHKASASSLTDVRVIVRMYNESSSTTTMLVEDSFNILQMPPVVTNIWFYLDGVAGSKAEVNRNVTIKIRATDDVNLNETAATVNVTYGGTTYVLNATALCGTAGECVGASGARTVANFSANFTPASSGLHSVKTMIYDTSIASNVSSAYTFTSYGTTTLNLTRNLSSLEIRSIDKLNKHVFYINYSVNNTGVVYGYNPFLNFSVNGSIVITAPANYTFSNMSSGTNTSKVFQINVSFLTPPGAYNVTTVIRWRNPDNTYSTASAVFNFTVLSNKSLAYSPSSLSYSSPLGEMNSSVLTINNTGNDALVGVNLSCYALSLCTNFTVVFNESNFNISANSSKQVNISITPLSGLAAGVYTGAINISEQNISATIDISSIVPESWIWSISPATISATRASYSSGDLQEVIIRNTGNVNITFAVNSSNSSIASSNVSSLLVPYGNNYSFMVNYTAPSTEGNWIVVLNVSNSSASPSLRNVTVNLTTTYVNVTIVSPTFLSPMQNVTSGMNISIIANVSYAGTVITENATFTVTINSSSCSSAAAFYSSGLWNVSCLAPSISDGKAYDLSVSMAHPTYGTISEEETGAVRYKDVSSPNFNLTRSNVNKNANVSLRINVTDNINISSVSAVLTYPNQSRINLSLSLSSGLYVNDTFALDTAGEYLVNYTASDTTGNVNSSSDWFEVLDRYVWNVNFLDYNSQAVSSANITLLRPNTTTILLNNATNSSGETKLSVNRRFYDIDIKIDRDEIIIRNVNFTNLSESNISINFYRMDGTDLAETITSYEPFIGIASNSSGLASNEVNAIFNYTGYGYDSSSMLGVVKCASWNYTSRLCAGSWASITSSVNRDTKKVQGNSTGFSSYFLAENKCGNGLCEVTYGETTTTCSADCQTTSVTVGGTTVGGGGGGVSTADLEKFLKTFLNVGGIKIETTSIYKEMFAGETSTVTINLANTLATASAISLSATGDIRSFIFFEDSHVDLNPKETRDVIVKIVIPKTTNPGNYEGDLLFASAGKEGKIPVAIRILSPEGKLLDVKILPLTASIEPGKVLRLQTELLNLGQTKRIDVQFGLSLIKVDTGEVVTRTEEAFAVETSVDTVKNLTIPQNTVPGKYMVQAIAYYSNVEQQFMQASSIAYVFVEYPFLKRKLFGVYVWIYLLAALMFISVDGVLFTSKWVNKRKKRFKGPVEFNKLPPLSSSSIFIGKVAETGIRTFIDLNKLQMHTLIAGSTGSGKTIAAQDIVEGALTHNKSVIVFDPTAQWTGFFKPSEDKGMLNRYKYFDMTAKNAKGFNGTIKTIHDPYELINVKDYIERKGEITIFDISSLSPKDIDIVIASTMEQIFKSMPEESRELKSLIVYDEVHRLLPKFGGSGKGFVQLERGVREFRKWGIGLVLISQVLSDFIGEIKANIGTEIQMGTRYEGDLERINLRYGEDMLKSVVKEPIGTGMMVNAEYNSGRPYFVSFRPLLHSTTRLSVADLKKYEQYFEQIEDLEYQVSELEKYGIDVFDLKLEVKIARDKIKVGQFQMADMYLESLLPVILGDWKSIGKNPEHLVKERIEREEVMEGISRSEKEREKYMRENPARQVSFREELLNLKNKVEEKKRRGKNTAIIESKIVNFQERLKPFKDRINAKDAEGIKQELESLKAEIEKL